MLGRGVKDLDRVLTGFPPVRAPCGSRASMASLGTARRSSSSFHALGGLRGRRVALRDAATRFRVSLRTHVEVLETDFGLMDEIQLASLFSLPEGTPVTVTNIGVAAARYM